MFCLLVIWLLVFIFNLLQFNYYASLRNRIDPEGMSLEELEITEMTTEALNAIMQRPGTRKFRNHILKHTANFLEKFGKILNAERTNADPNKVY